MKTGRILLLMGIPALCALFLLLAPSPDQRQAQSAPAPLPSAAPEQTATTPLFPCVDRCAALDMSIRASDRAFDFRQTADGAIVNGNAADNEILSTLIEQVTQMPITPRGAFSTAEAPLMTITVVCGGAEHTARFYRSQQEEDANVLYTRQQAQYYGITDAWRVGTLLLTCDGTRIFDEGGNESPIRQTDSPL